MKKSQVNVKRREVDITIEENDQSDSDGDNFGEKDMYTFPDPQALALKYGLVKEQSLNGSESKGAKDDTLNRDEIIAQEHALQMQSLVRKLEEKNKKIESLCTLLEVIIMNTITMYLPSSDHDRHWNLYLVWIPKRFVELTMQRRMISIMVILISETLKLSHWQRKAIAYKCYSTRNERMGTNFNYRMIANLTFLL